MALLTKLYIQDHPDHYLVTDFRCHYSRTHNGFLPTSRPTCNMIEITVVAPESDDFLFYEWFVNQTLLSGKLSYELPVTCKNAYPDARTIGFVDAKCLAFTEHYDIRQDIRRKSRRLLTMQIIPQRVKIDDIDVEHL